MNHWINAHLANIAYNDVGHHVSPIIQAAKHRFISFESLFSGVQYILYEHDDILVIVIRGTDQSADWLSNIDMRMHNRPYGGVHRGFYDDAMEILSRLELILKKYDRVRLIGHSLGGGTATVMACELLLVNSDLGVDGEVFGSPRALSVAAVEFFDSSVEEWHRWSHWLDPVPRGVLERWGYRHTKGGRTIWRPFICWPVRTGHSMDNYFERIKREEDA